MNRRLLTTLLRSVAGLVVIIVGVRISINAALSPWNASLRRPVDWRQLILGAALFAIGVIVCRESSK
jgi:hypothetical protein